MPLFSRYFIWLEVSWNAREFTRIGWRLRFFDEPHRSLAGARSGQIFQPFPGIRFRPVLSRRVVVTSALRSR